jgi:putative sigma-54 modulation protein
MKNPPIHVTPHDLHLSPALHDFIRIKICALSRFAGDIVAAEVVLRGKSGAAHLFSVSGRLALPGRDVQANATHTDLYGAINQLVTRLARLSRKRKTRLANLFRRPGKKGN